jgi:hypothetical protein
MEVTKFTTDDQRWTADQRNFVFAHINFFIDKNF